MTLRESVTACCFNFYAFIFQSSLLIETLDQVIMTLSRPLFHFLSGSCCGFGGGVTGIQNPYPPSSTHTPSISSFFEGRAPRLVVDSAPVPTVEAWTKFYEPPISST